MKHRFLLLLGTAFSLAGCQAPPEKVAAIAMPTPLPTSLITPMATPAPTAPLTVIRSNRPSLPTLPQMMDNSPRPTFVPRPTPKIRPGQTIIISNARPAPPPRENPTLVVSNASVLARDISPQAAADRGLVWVNTASPERIFHRPGGRFFGGTNNGYYTTEAQAVRRGYRASLR